MLLGIVASAVFLVRLLPQPIRLARTGVAEGVSALAALNATISAAVWIAYGLVAHLPVVWGVSVLALIPGVWQVTLLRREVTRRDLLAGGGFKHAGHLAFDTKKNYLLPNLFVSMLQRLGLEVDRFASSTGTMRGLER